MKYLALMSGFLNEAKNLPEWLSHHLNQGVEFFHLGNHNSTDDWQDAVAPFREYIHVFDMPEANTWPHRLHQTLDYMKGKARWVGHVNIDEYLMPERFGENVSDLFHAYDDLPGIGVHWLTFGTSFHKVRPHTLTVEAYTLRQPDDYAINSHVKAFVDPATPQKWSNPHFNAAVTMRDTDRRVIPDAIHGPITFTNFRLNHYVTRSEEEWDVKCERGGGDGSHRGPPGHPCRDVHQWEPYPVTDTRAALHGPAIRETMRRLGCQDIPEEP